MGRCIVSIFLFAACSSTPPGGVSEVDADELAADFTMRADAAPPASPDAAEPTDLSTLELEQASDMAEAPADLAPPCGGLGQACCAAYACSAGECMRSQMGYPPGSGIFLMRCLSASSCGHYNSPPCSFSGDAWCGRDPYASSDGNASGWLTGSPCKP